MSSRHEHYFPLLMILFVEIMFLRIWKSTFKSKVPWNHHCSGKAVLLESVRSLGIEIVMVYVARKMARVWEHGAEKWIWICVSGSNRKPVIDWYEFQDEINYLMAGHDDIFMQRPHHIEYEVKKGKKSYKAESKRSIVGKCKETYPPQLKFGVHIEGNLILNS